MSTVTVIGGHGKVALLLAPLLVEAGHDVRSWIRKPEQADDVRAAGAEPVVTDVEQLSTDEIAQQLVGSDAVVWAAGAGGGSPERTYAVDRDAALRSFDAAAQAGVKRYLIISYFGAGPDHGVPEDNAFFAYADAKSAADKALAGSSLAWTILRPSSLTLEDPTGRIETSDAGATGGKVSRANVAQTIAAALADDDTIGRTIEFNDGDTPIAEAIKG